ncbi:hypothetical protein [Epilithonimonas mollis]|uniref:hypothetical protein n=1 Tax=Epilithonimonas mollis TaxID=216903 RepID=UPI000932A363|nr:hypothetical protein [Epilithonimonas mollis]
MKLIINLLLVFYLVLRPVMPLVEYVVNYDYISDVLCINKKKPELHCNGKCYLGKELAKSSSEDSKSKNPAQKIIDCYIPVEISVVKTVGQRLLSGLTFTHTTDYSYLYLKHIFRPPIV